MESSYTRGWAEDSPPVDSVPSVITGSTSYATGRVRARRQTLLPYPSSLHNPLFASMTEPTGVRGFVPGVATRDTLRKRWRHVRNGHWVAWWVPNDAKWAVENVDGW